MEMQEIFNTVQDIFRDNFDDDTLEITRATCADDIEDWDSLEQIKALWAIDKVYSPNMEESRRETLLKGWKKAVRCALFWANDEEE